MKKRNLMAILACTVCLATASAGAPAVMAEETEAVTEAATEAADTEAAAEAATEAAENSTEADTEETYEKVPRPDYTASDYVELGEYKGLTVKIAPIEVTDEEILAQISANAGSDAMEDVTEGTVEEGDTANIDYVGKLDGEAFDGGTAKGYDLEIGSGTFIDGFEDGLVGVKIGDTVDLTLTFPESYPSEELAGKETVFTVTVNSVKRMKELTSDLVSTITDGEYTDVDAYKESVKETLIKNKEDLYPLVKEKLIDPNTIIVDAKSGTSGAGRGAKIPNLFCEVNESIKAYGVTTHRHTPEIEEQLGYAYGSPIMINFTPHLVPMNRGILVTAYASLKEKVDYDTVRAAYDKYYANERFVRVLDKDVCPETRWVEGSNYVDVNFKIDERTGRIIAMGALDNLVKGAAGQAVQNMNIMFGLPEEEGLLMAPVFP